MTAWIFPTISVVLAAVVVFLVMLFSYISLKDKIRLAMIVAVYGRRKPFTEDELFDSFASRDESEHFLFPEVFPVCLEVLCDAGVLVRRGQEGSYTYGQAGR